MMIPNLIHSKVNLFEIEHEIHPMLEQNLVDCGIKSLFPVQRLVIPYLMRSIHIPCAVLRDICVSAPTGSGKTLSYAIPIVQSLLVNSISDLQAVVILPSRELAEQVYGVFQSLCKQTNIRICCATGQSSFEAEQKILVGSSLAYSSDSSYVQNLFTNHQYYMLDSKSQCQSREEGASLLVCTTGRLLEHLQKTRGFSLSKLRYLVLDEADKLLGNAYHNWVRTVIQSTHSTSFQGDYSLTSDESLRSECHDLSNLLTHFQSIQQPLQKLLFSATLTDNPRKLTLLGIRNPIILQSELQDKHTTEGIDRNEEESLNPSTPTPMNPPVIAYRLPRTLTESICVVSTVEQPLILCTLLLQAIRMKPTNHSNDLNNRPSSGKDENHIGCCSDKGDLCLIFVSSIDNTHRLCRLLQAVNGQISQNTMNAAMRQKNEKDRERYRDSEEIDGGDPSSSRKKRLRSATVGEGDLLYEGYVAEMSSLMRSEQRQEVMTLAHNHQLKILVATDQMARGIDLSSVRLVVNYDPPTHVRTYIHRVGRTARANKTGHAITILKHGQSSNFNRLRSQIEGVNSDSSRTLKKCKVDRELGREFEDVYKQGMKRFRRILELEGRKAIDRRLSFTV